MLKHWSVAQIDKEQVKETAKRCNLPAFITMLLAVRGIVNENEIDEFLSDEPNISFPNDIKDMDKAVARIQKALDDFEMICVYGDYDADGVTSTAMLYSYFEAVGAAVTYYIPSRESEGYGMNKDAIDKLKKRRVSLIVTVDNGVAAAEEIEYAKSIGIDTVVTDHHMPPEVLPKAQAVVDLHRADCPSKFKELCGVGVAFKLIMALEGEECDVLSLLENYAEIAAFGTIGDIVTLKGENRTLVKYGIKSLEHTERAGVIALIENSGLYGKPITASRIGFTLVPRINAGGRLGLSEKSVKLLLTDDFYEAGEIAEELGNDNSERQKIEKEIFSYINDMVAENPNILLDRVVVIAGENWHPGVIGIVAARVKEKIGKPCIIISHDGESGKGSGRSIEGFSLCDAVYACKDLLTHSGGHPMAIGLGIKTENIEKFRVAINEYAAKTGEMPFAQLKLDCKLNPALLNIDIAKQMKYLEPYGAGNPTPMFALNKMTLTTISEIGGGKHLRLCFTRDKSVVNAMLFFKTRAEFPYSVGEVLDLAITTEINLYSGHETLSVFIKDMKLSNIDNDVMIKEERIFESFLRHEKLSRENLSAMLPTREDFACVYRFLKSNDGFVFTDDILCSRLPLNINYAKLQVILKAMDELSLIKRYKSLINTRTEMLEAKGKVSIDTAPIIICLRGEITK